MIKVNIVLTASKVLAYLIFVIGVVYGFVFHDPSIMITAFSISGGLMGVKTFTSGWVQNNSNATINQNINETQSYNGMVDNPDV